MSFERRIVMISTAAVGLVAAAALVLVWVGDFSSQVLWTVVFVIAVAGFIATWVLHESLVYPLRTVSNLITALREEDYSLRAHKPRRDDALGDVLTEVNALAHLMESRKLQSVEASALLRSVLAQIDVAIFAFDADRRLRLVNAAGEELLGATTERLVGAHARELQLDALVDGDGPLTLDHRFPGRTGRWRIGRSSFRQGGVSHRLLIIADITRALREEETEAWRRIVRVLGHELNNSLAPIRSIASSLEQIVRSENLPSDWRDDVTSGMRVIGTRTEALTRFTRSYAQLARLPDPRKKPVAIDEVVRRTARLQPGVELSMTGPELQLDADPDQLEQLLINLMRNAAEASRECGSAQVTIRWRATADSVILEIEDEGPGTSGTENLFVPFFTTKPHGSGIGLYLSRQIAEAHGGTLTLENRAEQRGAVARLRLPLG